MVESLIFLLSLSSGVMPQSVNNPMVRSLKVSNPADFMAPPVIRIGSKDSLTINFDIIGEEREYLRYRLLHCNSDWTPSRLLDQEYLSGFNEAEVVDFGYSSNTFVHYVNYNIEIPSPEMEPLTGGNYIIQVYREDSPDEILFQTVFFVSENTIPISGEVSTRTDKGFNTEFQQLELIANLGETPNLNPWQDVKICVVQNNDFRNTRIIRNPLRIEGGRAIYSHNPELIFQAGNEFRRFETVRSDYPGMHVDSVSHSGSHYYAYLTPDLPLAGREYIFDNTQHGRFKIDEYNSTNPDLGADYIITHFSLQLPEQPGKDVHVDGEFSRGLPGDVTRMRFNHEAGVYELEIPLKQGSYNYSYIISDSAGRETTPDGNHYETSNEYLVLIYTNRPGDRAERLAGAAKFTTR